MAASIQLKVEDQIPFADGSCDGSVSSVGTGSVLGHSTTSEEFQEKNGSDERLCWNKYASRDQHSLNNILDTVSSSQTDVSLVDEHHRALEIVQYETAPVMKAIRPTSLCVDAIEDSPRRGTPSKGYVSLMSAYTSVVNEQVHDTITKSLLKECAVFFSFIDQGEQTRHLFSIAL